MKRKFIWVFSFACLGFVGFAMEISAQRRAASSGEFYDAQNKSYQSMRDRSYRTETKDEAFSEGSLVKMITRITEKLLPNRSRSYYRVNEGGKVIESESILIDNFLYARENSGPWTKTDLSKSGSGGGSGSATSATSCRQLTVEAVVFEGRPSLLFNELLILGSNTLTFSERQKWFADDGLILKEEILEGSLSPRTETRRFVVTYEYDPEIKIEAPIK